MGRQNRRFAPALPFVTAALILKFHNLYTKTSRGGFYEVKKFLSLDYHKTTILAPNPPISAEASLKLLTEG